MATYIKHILRLLSIILLSNFVSSKIIVNRVFYNDFHTPQESNDLNYVRNSPLLERAGILNFKPIIGILAQETTPSMTRTLNYTSYIASSYVKFLEAAGARVVPVLIDEPSSYYMKLSRNINGFMFPGGSLPVDSTTGYGRAGKTILSIVQRAAKKKRQLPVWGTCLGFEMIIFRLAKADLRQRCQASNFPSSVKLYPGYENSRLFKKAPQHLLYNLSHKNITANFHHWCISPQNFSNQLNQTMNILSTSFDENGIEYVSIAEHRWLQIYGTQWHPEKSQFEWPTRLDHSEIPHGIEAVEASQYMANFFVEQARHNKNRYRSKNKENAANIHNYKEIYLPSLNITNFQQSYFFA